MQIDLLSKKVDFSVFFVFWAILIVLLSWLSFNTDNDERDIPIGTGEEYHQIQTNDRGLQIAEPNELICHQNLQISLGEDCEAILTPYMMLSNTTPGCCDTYEVNILDNQSNPIGNVATADMLGSAWIVEVRDTVSGDVCYAQGITFVDVHPPVLVCHDTIITCVEDIDGVPPPGVTDSCDDNPVIQLTSAAYVDNNFCDNDTAVYQKTWTAFDASGNQSPTCVQQIFINRLPLVLPEDIVWTCDQYGAFPNITAPAALHDAIVDADTTDGQQDIDVDRNLADSLLANTGSGMPTSYDQGSGACDYNIVFADQILDDCGAGTFQILRHWTILDQCTNQVTNHYQVISVSDIVGPMMTPMDTVVVSADIPASGVQLCKSTGFIPAPAVQDNCSGFQSMQIFTSLGEVVNYQYGTEGQVLGGYIPLPGLSLGVHEDEITYYATDSCGNVSTLSAPVKVIDDISPSAVCKYSTQVVISNGTSGISAAVFDDGSNDNCCLDHFEVRRTGSFCASNPADTTFSDVVHFCCEDIGEPVIVQLKAVDCFGNANVCEVSVGVQNTGMPQCEPPSDVTFFCYSVPDSIFEDDDSLALNLYFGTPEATGNCDAEIRYLPSIDNRDDCGTGTFIRQFKAVDGNQESAVCTQTIALVPEHHYVLSLPPDTTIAGCAVSDSLLLTYLNSGCDQIGLTYQDQKLFFGQPNYCYKIIRDYTILVECEWDGVSTKEELPRVDNNDDGFADAQMLTFVGDTNSGYYSYRQVLTVVDTLPPVVTYEGTDRFYTDMDFSHGEDACQEFVQLPVETTDDCSDTMIISWILFKDIDNDGVLDTEVPYVDEILNQGTGIFSGVLDVYAGYGLAYYVTDECGNMAEYIITFDVVDGITPTVHCGARSFPLNPNRTLVVNPMMMVDKLNGEPDYYDNCDDILQLSFSSDVNDTFRIYGCDQIGESIPLEIWATDSAGNHGVCTDALLTIEEDGQCFYTIEGRVHSAGDKSISDVLLSTNEVDSTVFTATTSTDGTYQMQLDAGYDYTVVPGLNDNTHSYVSTMDLLAIRDHILGIHPLTSPYQLIAADANRSKSITGLDMVMLRRYILWQYVQFPVYPSWRFVDAEYIFPDSIHPFSPDFPEIKNFNNLDSNITGADFLGIVIGDINGSWENAAKGVEERSDGSMKLPVQDRYIERGELFSIKIQMEESEISGLQFALQFDIDRLEFRDLKPELFSENNIGLSLLNEGIITASWISPVNSQIFSSDDCLFELSFRAREDGHLSDLLHIPARYLHSEAYGADGEIFDLNLDFIQNGKSFPTVRHLMLYQNVPNPFNDNTEIAFSLPTSSDVVLTIQDISGKVIKIIKGNYPKGMNKIMLSKTDLKTAGVLYYQLSTPSESAVKKMVIF